MSERYILDGLKNLIPFVPYEKAIYSLTIDATRSHVIIGEDVQIGSAVLIRILNSSEYDLYTTNNSGQPVRYVSLVFSINTENLRAFCLSLSSGGSAVAAKSLKTGNYVLMFVALGL